MNLVNLLVKPSCVKQAVNEKKYVSPIKEAMRKRTIVEEDKDALEKAREECFVCRCLTKKKIKMVDTMQVLKAA